MTTPRRLSCADTLFCRALIETTADGPREGVLALGRRLLAAASRLVG